MFLRSSTTMGIFSLDLKAAINKLLLRPSRFPDPLTSPFSSSGRSPLQYSPPPWTIWTAPNSTAAPSTLITLSRSASRVADRVGLPNLLAFEAHNGQKRRSGEPFIIHPVAVAQILGELVSKLGKIKYEDENHSAQDYIP